MTYDQLKEQHPELQDLPDEERWERSAQLIDEDILPTMEISIAKSDVDDVEKVVDTTPDGMRKFLSEVGILDKTAPVFSEEEKAQRQELSHKMNVEYVKREERREKSFQLVREIIGENSDFVKEDIRDCYWLTRMDGSPESDRINRERLTTLATGTPEEKTRVITERINEIMASKEIKKGPPTTPQETVDRYMDYWADSMSVMTMKLGIQNAVKHLGVPPLDKNFNATVQNFIEVHESDPISFESMSVMVQSPYYSTIDSQYINGTGYLISVDGTMAPNGTKDFVSAVTKCDGAFLQANTEKNNPEHLKADLDKVYATAAGSLGFSPKENISVIRMNEESGVTERVPLRQVIEDEIASMPEDFETAHRGLKEPTKPFAVVDAKGNTRMMDMKLGKLRDLRPEPPLPAVPKPNWFKRLLGSIFTIKSVVRYNRYMEQKAALDARNAVQTNNRTPIDLKLEDPSARAKLIASPEIYERAKQHSDVTNQLDLKDALTGDNAPLKQAYEALSQEDKAHIEVNLTGMTMGYTKVLSTAVRIVDGLETADEDSFNEYSYANIASYRDTMNRIKRGDASVLKDLCDSDFDRAQDRLYAKNCELLSPEVGGDTDRVPSIEDVAKRFLTNAGQEKMVNALNQEKNRIIGYIREHDAPHLRGRALDVPDVDEPELDEVEMDEPEVDAPQVQNPQKAVPQKEAPQIGGPRL